MNQFVQFSSYTPAADIVVTTICLVMIILVVFSNISRTKSFHLFLTVVCLELAAAWADISFYTLAALGGHEILANWMRCIFHILLFLILVYFIAYICEATQYEKQRWYLFIANAVFAVVILMDIITTAQGITFIVDGEGISFVRRGIFIYGYLAISILCIVLLAKVRKLLYRRIMFGFYGTLAVSFLVLVMQGMSGQSSFTVTTLMLPTIAMMYVLHSNPYDALLGANDAKAMQEYILYCYEKEKDFIFISLYMKEFDGQGKDFPKEMQAQIRQFSYKLAKKARMFKAGKGHMVMIFLKKNYPDYEQRIHSILEAFYPLYEQFQYDYKIVIGSNIDELSKKNEYISYIRSIHRTMPECSVHRVDSEDIVKFNRTQYILKELADINRKCDPDDPRVLAYCQPVLNVRTGEYDTAEALMRLNLKETGIVYPDQFIHLAEEQGYIHTLTLIILHKTSEAIRQFTEDGYLIRRISINVSVPELKDECFCSDIIKIIRKNGIPGDKIAIELTESQNEGDFMLMKQKIGELKENGIQFYLDDFGTGYSNMERIMELPFDIIKFDRTLVIASESEDRSRKMVANLANMFSDMDYHVLYEGVEKDTEEVMCRNMSATYLQGFKYSKPTPIVELKNYLSRKTG